MALFLTLPFYVIADTMPGGFDDASMTGAPVGGGAVSGVGTVGGGAVSGVGTVGGAQGTPFQAAPQFANPLKDEYNTFPKFVAGVTKAAVDILMPFVVLAFIWSGFLFVRAQGNETELEKAKSAIKWSVIGAFILLGAWGFAQIIGTTVSTITN